MIRQKSSINAYIGGQIRKGRKLKGLSQKDLANRIKPRISSQQIQKYENASNRISAEALVACAFAMELPMNFFLPDHESFSDSLNQQELQLLSYFRDLPKEAKEALISLLCATNRATQ